ncbi:KpsF/GutQ family sugar-phosphate isomerase [Candidatus Kaiserbacteria bacterium]|nr:KpsF/GutQ family sugar-phosphate isomerase [Candidatus Kaiserbacteria bacterium]
MKNANKRAKYTLEKQIEGLNALKGSLGDDFERAILLIKNRKGKIVVTGVGKSGFIGMKMAATLVSLGHTAHFMHPVEALHGDTGLVSDGDVIIAFSFSGKSPEINRIISYLKKTFTISVIAITGNCNSPLAEQSNTCILVPVTEEGCPLNLAPMASTTTSLVIADLIASALTSPDSFNKKNFAKFHPGGSLGLQLVQVSEVMLVGKDIPLVTEETPMTDVLNEMEDRERKGVAGVLDNNGRLVGIITDGDTRRFLIKNTTLTGKFAKDVMTRNPRTIPEGESIEKALNLMKEYKVTHLFVTNPSDELVGIVYLRTILDEYVI